MSSPALKIETEELSSLLSAYRSGRLLLPNFQRDFVWGPEKWEGFLASLMLQYPIGMMLIGVDATSHCVQMKHPLSMSNDICLDLYQNHLGKANIEYDDSIHDPVELLQSLDEGFDCRLLLDGQQRLTALDLIFSDAYHSVPSRELHWSKRFRWFVNLSCFGLLSLDWPDLTTMTHMEVREAIVSKKYRLSHSTDYDHGAPDQTLYEYCAYGNDVDTVERGLNVLIPLDRIYSYRGSGSVRLDWRFANAVLNMVKENVFHLIENDEMGGGINFEAEISNETRVDLEDRFENWKYAARDLFRDVLSVEVPIAEVDSSEFTRISGIFSVINLAGVDLDTFDLLVAKTARMGETIRDEFLSAVQQFGREWSSNAEDLVPGTVVTKLRANGIPPERFWSLGYFIGEKKSKRREIDNGTVFPEKRRKVFAQLIALMSRIGTALDDNNTDERWYTAALEREGESPVTIVRKVLALGDEWNFSDNAILRTARSDVWRYAEQAGKQLLRGMAFAAARLGVPRYKEFPYKRMLLPLASVMTDEIWRDVVAARDGGWRRKKIEKWYWCSLFGGAYLSRQGDRVRHDIPRLLAYLATPEVSWEELSEVTISEGGEDRTSRGPAIQGYGPGRMRFEGVFEVPGYSDDAMMKGKNKALATAVRNFIIRNGALDAVETIGEERKVLHAGFEELNGTRCGGTLEREHIVAFGGWNRWVEEDDEVDRRDSQHPLNSPMNYTFLSREANRQLSDTDVFLKLDVRNSEMHRVCEDHLIDQQAIRNTVEEFMGMLQEDGESMTHEEMMESLLEPLLENRYRRLKTQVEALREQCV